MKFFLNFIIKDVLTFVWYQNFLIHRPDHPFFFKVLYFNFSIQWYWLTNIEMLILTLQAMVIHRSSQSKVYQSNSRSIVYWKYKLKNFWILSTIIQYQNWNCFLGSNLTEQQWFKNINDNNSPKKSSPNTCLFFWICECTIYILRTILYQTQMNTSRKKILEFLIFIF